MISIVLTPESPVHWVRRKRELTGGDVIWY